MHIWTAGPFFNHSQLPVEQGRDFTPPLSSYKEQAALISKYPTAAKAARDFTVIFISSAQAEQASTSEGMPLNCEREQVFQGDMGLR